MRFTFSAPASLLFVFLLGFFCPSQEPFQDKKVFASSVAFSPDGKYFAAGGRSPFDTKRKDAVQISVFEPGLKGVLKVWESHSGKEIWDLFDSDKKIRCLEFSPAGPFLAVCYRGSSQRLPVQRKTYPLIVWDVKTKEKKIVLPECCGYDCLAFSLDGKWLATGSMVSLEEQSPESWFTLWEMPSGKEKHKTKLPGGTRSYPQLVDSLAFSPDNSTVAIGTYESDLFVFDLKTKKASKLIGAGPRSPTALAFSPDGKFLAFVSRENEVRVFNWGKRELVGKFSAYSHACTGVVFRPDSNMLFTSGIEFDAEKKTTSGAWKAWAVPEGRLVFTGKTEAKPGSIAISPDGKKVLLGDPWGPVELCNVPKELQMEKIKGK